MTIGNARKDFKIYTDVTKLTWRKIVIIKYLSFRLLLKIF